MSRQTEIINKWCKFVDDNIKNLVSNNSQRFTIKGYVHMAISSAIMENGVQTPKKDVCWFCGVHDKDLVFDTEFDTYVHLDCISTALNENPLHPEANLMKYLFKPL